MPNVKHSSKSVECYTPPLVIDLARQITGAFALDPASSRSANRIVGAREFWTRRDRNPLKRPWCTDGPVWLNPPGGTLDPVTLRPPVPGRKGGRPLSSAATWWRKMRNEFELRHFTEGWFLSFTLELLATSQQAHPGRPFGVLEFPTLIFRKRLRFVDRYGRPIRVTDADGKVRHASPTHHNALTLVSRRRGAAAELAHLGRDLGVVVSHG